MTATLHRNSRGLAFYLALMMLFSIPFQGMSTQSSARAEIGVKTLVLGAALGAGGLFALKAMLGPVSAVGTLGGAGTGFATAIGRAAGGLMSGISSVASTLATGAMSMLTGVGRMLSSGLSGAATMVTQPWFLVSAAAIGGGLLVYHFYKKSKAGGEPVADNRQVMRPMGFFDRLQARLRNPFGPMRPLMPAPYSGAYYGGMSNFYMGGPAPFATANVAYTGGFGSAAASAAGAQPVTVMGDAAVPGTDVTLSNRAALHPAAPANSAELAAKLEESEKNRRAAYERLVEALRGRASETAGAADPVAAAIRDYKDAHRESESLRQQLEAR